MNIEPVSFGEFPFSKLFNDYLSGSKELLSFFDFDPLSDDSLDERIENFSFQGDRHRISNALTDFNQRFDAPQNTLDSIKKLRDESSIAVVTGQQMTLYGGPMFTIYKIITAIHKARQLERRSGRSVIPLFWLADEDHDYEEVAAISLPVQDEQVKVFYEALQGRNMRISDLKIDNSFESFRNQILELLQESEFRPALLEMLDGCYSDGQRLGISFGKFILKLFGKYGLVLAGSNDKEFKKLVQNPLSLSIQKASELHDTLIDTSGRLSDAGYHNQVTIQESNLFWIDENGKRIKIKLKGDQWFVDGTEIEWSSEELIQKIRSEPDSFSPNVFMRPIVQNYLIPAVAYVAGPGEIAYYAQMREFYRHFDLKMPVIIPRFSITMVESPVARILDKLPFQIPEYMERIEDLEKMYIKRSETPDIETIFKEWKSSVKKESDGQVGKVAEIDPTLKKSADKTVSQFFTELDKLKGKLYRSVKDDEKTQLKRILKIQKNLFPDMNLQEREVAFIYFMNRYGMDIWDQLYDQLADHQPDSHKIVYL